MSPASLRTRPWTAFGVGVGVAGAALRRTWGEAEGAIGLWLWSAPGLLRPRSGAVSVWRDEDGLRAFVVRQAARGVIAEWAASGWVGGGRAEGRAGG